MQQSNKLLEIKPRSVFLFKNFHLRYFFLLAALRPTTDFLQSITPIKLATRQFVYKKFLKFV